jgi:hypothetical protein
MMITLMMKGIRCEEVSSDSCSVLVVGKAAKFQEMAIFSFNEL